MPHATNPAAVRPLVTRRAFAAAKIAARLIVWLASLWAGAVVGSRAAPAQETVASDPYLGVLRQFDIDPTFDGISTYLRSLTPTAEELQERQRQIAKYIALLGDEDFHVREQATRDLIAIVDLAGDALDEARGSPDPEIAFRAERILQAGESRREQQHVIQTAVCRTIERQRIEGLTSVLLDAMPTFRQSHVLVAAGSALSVTAGPEDLALLRHSIHGDNKNVRIAAIGALARLLGEDSIAELREQLTDGDPQVRLAAARALANLGNRASLAALGDLLLHPELAVRAEAVSMLRALTGQKFAFAAYDPDDVRAKAAARWDRWIEESGPTAELAFPLRSRRVEVGHTLVLLFRESTAIELDATGKEIWRRGNLNFPWAIQHLPNGNRLIGSYRGKFIVELDAQGKEVWRKDGMPGGVFGVHRLDNGNTLAGCHVSRSVVELDPAGKVVWTASFDGQPMDVRRLENGRTLVALHIGKKVVEVDRAGKVVWQVAGLGIPRTAMRLENGNTLVSDEGTGRVDEFDRSGKSVWSVVGLDHPYDAQRLADGRTLITDATGLRIVDHSGKVVWQKRMAGVGRAVRF